MKLLTLIKDYTRKTFAYISRFFKLNSAEKGRKPYIGRIDRYIIKKFLGTYFFSIALIMAIATIFDFNERIDKVNEELSVEQKKLDDSNKFMETFDKEKYTDNFNIITYIRNAISHGNLKINEDENIADISKKKIRIVNEYEGKVYYDKEVSLEQFSTLFSDDNHEYIHNFLTGNIDDGKLKEDIFKEDLDKGKVKMKKR